MKWEQNINKTKESFQYKLGQIVWRFIGDQKKGNNYKLTAKYGGPYEIIRVHDNNVNYTIRNLYNENEELTVHGNKLILCRKPYNRESEN